MGEEALLLVDGMNARVIEKTMRAKVIFILQCHHFVTHLSGPSHTFNSASYCFNLDEEHGPETNGEGLSSNNQQLNE